uniref:DNA-directed RNA polymerase IV seventh largest subunit n=1 Tax=Ephedra trifurca TaxID=39583 RepID=A0A0C4W281_9SPER|nr:DNA-directed RNA polymerase IV seventh largest subunit [Ephedra trifurca]
MFFEIELSRNVVVQPQKLYTGFLQKRSIILQLMSDITQIKADEEHGYYVALTTLEGVGEAKIRPMTGAVVFPVKFKCIVFRPLKNEVLVGEVQNVTKVGVLMSCGPMKELFIHSQFVGGFEFIQGHNPVLRKQDLTIEKGTKLRFKLMSLKWVERDRMFRALGTLAGDYLGPIDDLVSTTSKVGVGNPEAEDDIILPNTGKWSKGSKGFAVDLENEKSSNVENGNTNVEKWEKSPIAENDRLHRNHENHKSPFAVSRDVKREIPDNDEDPDVVMIDDPKMSVNMPKMDDLRINMENSFPKKAQTPSKPIERTINNVPVIDLDDD